MLMRATLLVAMLGAELAAAQIYDIVIQNGRVMDPESKLDGVRNVGIAGGKIRAITTQKLQGKTTIDAAGLIVAPGFIDLHAHGQDEENNHYQVMDGVTTALELEVGTADIDQWYAAREGKAPINFGASVGHVPVRMAVMHDPGKFLPSGDAAHRPATEEEITECKRRIEQGLKRGALAVGFGIQYTPQASRWEILEMFRVAARSGAGCHVHMRNAGEREPANSIQALEEVIAASASTGAPLHVVHITSNGLGATPKLLQIIGEARGKGLDVTTECYPYNAAMTEIQSAIFDEGWRQVLNVDYNAIEWVATGERLTAGSFARYRKTGGSVIMHAIPDSAVEIAVASPLTMIASDGLIQNGKGHPRGSGTYARVLGHYVRETNTLTLMDALRKMTLMPAQRLERRVPTMKNKGRVRLAADADVTIFDPARVIDRSTFQEPANFSEGIQYVLVNGTIVVHNGQLRREVKAGRAVRAPI